MRKTKWIYAAVVVGMAALLSAGCGKRSTGGEEEPKEAQKAINTDDATIQGMYLTFGEDEDNYIFADMENHSLFYADIPKENLLDETGGELDEDALQKGDIVAVYNNGIILESYPPQYPGVTKMVRVKKGTAEDAKQYDELIAQIYQAPDPSEIPYLDIENKQKTAVVTSVINHGSYSWNYTDENGNVAVEADAAHVLQWKRSDAELVELTCDAEDKDLKLMFSRKPKNVKVTRWDDTATVDDIEKGEPVKVELDGKEAEIETAVPGSVYEVIGEWENGTVVYGFAVK